MAKSRIDRFGKTSGKHRAFKRASVIWTRAANSIVASGTSTSPHQQAGQMNAPNFLARKPIFHLRSEGRPQMFSVAKFQPTIVAVGCR
jgi:hypothetical protein